MHQHENGYVVTSVTTQMLLKGFLMSKAPEVLAKKEVPSLGAKGTSQSILHTVMNWTFN